jgi:hypothetical protein
MSRIRSKNRPQIARASYQSHESISACAVSQILGLLTSTLAASAISSFYLRHVKSFKASHIISTVTSALALRERAEVLDCNHKEFSWVSLAWSQSFPVPV